MSDEGVQITIDEKDDKTYKKPVGTVFPTFFVGVGGCGSGIVQNIRKFVTSRPDYEQRYKKLVHFMAFDTDQDDLKDLDFPGFLISDFPKGEYVNIKMGKEYKKADPFFQQWWPDWYASRPDSTKGAGQIRVESRLSLYYQLDQDRSQIISQINDLILQAKDHDNPFRSVRPPAAYVHIFCSVAGGTGSGGLMTLGYLFKELLKSARLSPVVVANAVLPTLFYRKVRPRLHDDIRSNGYAALKELEWFQTLGYNNNPRMERGDIKSADQDKIEFNYNPNSQPESGNQVVRSAPFDLINIIDQPGDFSFNKPKDIYPAIAGAAYVQLFSPIMGQRESEEDNYYKKIKHLDGGFSQNWGTYGLAMLVLPDKPIMHYCADRMAAAMLENIEGGDISDLLEQITERARGEINTCKGSPKTLQEMPNVKILKAAGLLFTQFGDDPELSEILNQGLGGQSGDWKSGVVQALEKELKAAVKKASSTVKKTIGAQWDASGSVPETPPEGNADSVLDELLSELNKQLEKRRGVADKKLHEIIDDVVKKAVEEPLGDKSKDCDPLAMKLGCWWMAKKVLQNEATTQKPPTMDYKADFTEEFRDTIKAWAATSTGEKLGITDDDWNGAPEAATTECKRGAEEVAQKCAPYGAYRIQKAMYEQLEDRLSEAGKLSTLAKELREEFEKSAAKALKDESGMSREFILDAEVMKGLRTGNRYWDRLWWWLVKHTDGLGCKADTNGSIKAELIDVLALKGEIDDALRRLKQKHQTEQKTDEDPPHSVQKNEAKRIITTFCRKRLVGPILGERQAGDDRSQKGLLIDTCLWLEAKWELEDLLIEDHLVNYEGGLKTQAEKEKLAHELAKKYEPKRDELQQYITEKIAFLCEKSRVLARLRLTESSAVDPFVFIAASSHYAENLSLDVGEDGMGALSPLTGIIKKSHQLTKAARYLDGWVDEKRIAIYQGQAGLPVHNFWPVNGEMLESYERIYRDYVSGYDKNAKPKKDFPSHIDRNFEDPDEWDPHAVLPSLKPSRSVTSGSTSDRGFFELIAHGIVHEIEVGKGAEAA